MSEQGDIEVTVSVEAEPGPEVTIEEVASLVDAAIDAVVEEVTAEEHHDDNVALLAGVTVAALDALTGRVDALEVRTMEAQVTADVALGAAAEVAAEVATEPEQVEVVEEPTIEPDEPPATRRNKFNQWFFGKKKPVE